jgi:hypothetical protein
MTLKPPDVAGIAETCELLAISRQAFDKTHRHRPDFPPCADLANGPVWERRAIVAYARQRKTGRPHLDTLTTYRAMLASDSHHPVLDATHALNEAGHRITRTTVRRYLQQLGEIPR